MNQGWAKVHRKLLDNPVFANAELLKMWIWCLLKASHKDHEVLFGLDLVTLKEGEFITGRTKGASELCVNQSTWYKHMKALQSMKMVCLKSNNKNTIVSICNWATYQSNEPKEISTKEQQKNNKVTTKEQQNNTYKNEENADTGKNEENSLPPNVGNVDLLGNPIPASPPKKHRERNPLFDAVASADGNPEQLTRSAIGRVVRAKQEIVEACPDVTPEEIYRRIENLKTFYELRAVTSTSLAKNWAKCDGQNKPAKKYVNKPKI